MTAAPQTTAQRKVLGRKSTLKEQLFFLLLWGSHQRRSLKVYEPQRVFITTLWWLHLGIWNPNAALRLLQSPYLSKKMTFWLESPQGSLLTAANKAHSYKSQNIGLSKTVRSSWLLQRAYILGLLFFSAFFLRTSHFWGTKIVSHSQLTALLTPCLPQGFRWISLPERKALGQVIDRRRQWHLVFQSFEDSRASCLHPGPGVPHSEGVPPQWSLRFLQHSPLQSKDPKIT